MYWWLKCLPHTWRLEFKSPEPTQCCDGSNNLPAITALRKEKRDCWDKMASYRSQIDKPWVHWETQPKWRRWRVVKKGFPCQIWTSPGTGTHLDLYLLHICPHIHLIMHTHHARIGIGKKILKWLFYFFSLSSVFWLHHFLWTHLKSYIFLPFMIFCTTSRSILEIIKWFDVILFSLMYVYVPLWVYVYYVGENALGGL